MGLEPTLLSELEPKSNASASSATLACAQCFASIQNFTRNAFRIVAPLRALYREGYRIRRLRAASGTCQRLRLFRPPGVVAPRHFDGRHHRLNGCILVMEHIHSEATMVVYEDSEQIL